MINPRLPDTIYKTIRFEYFITLSNQPGKAMAAPSTIPKNLRTSTLRSICLISLMSLLGCTTPNPNPITVEIVEYGIEERVSERIVENHNTASGKVRLVKKFQFKEKTTDIPAELGTAFSMCIRVKGVPRSRWHDLQSLVTHPTMTSPDGRQWITQRGSANPVALDQSDSLQSCIGYGLDQPFEVVPGQWTLALEYAGKTLAKKQFNLR